MPLLLLVDDMPEIALIAQRLSQRAGYEMVSAGNASTGWEHLQKIRPDLLLLDLNLPGVGGAELCRRIRDNQEFRQLPIALFTHWDRPEDIAAGLEAGAEYVVSKDLLCQPEGWRRRLDEILTRANRRPTPI